MVKDWGIPLQSGPGGISAHTRLMTRLAAIAVWLALGFALLATEPRSLQNPVSEGVAAVRLEPRVRQKTPVVSLVPEAPAEEAVRPAKPVAVDRVSTPSALVRPSQPSLSTQARIAASPAAGAGRPVSTGPAGIGPSAPRVAGGAGGSADGASAGSLTASSQAIIKAQACAQLDPKDRPPDCPTNAELKRLLQLARGPKYRPENAEAFSRNELRWRDIPPPCLEDGQKVKMTGMGACVRFGNTPSRVRSPQEICEAKGLGGCAPVPSQAAVNAAVKQAKGQ